MSASKNEFINVRMSMEVYQGLPKGYREFMEMRYVDEEGIDYTQCPQWVAQKKVSDKEFKKLKEIEFNYRHKIK